MTRSPNSTSSLYGFAIALLGLMAGLGMIYVVFDAQSFVRAGFDPYYFGEMGKSLARGEGFERYGVLLRRRSPLYPLVIGGIYAAFGEHPRLVQWLQCFLLAATCWLVFDMGRRIFNLRTGVIAGAACALHPMMLRYVADLQLETLLTFFVTSMIWMTVRFYLRPSIASAVWLGVAGAAASLTKAVVILYPPLFLGIWLIGVRARRFPALAGRSPFTAVVAVGLTMGLMVAPWTYRNYRATHGRFVLITTGFSDAFLRGYIFSQADYALLRKPPYTDAENESNALFERLSREAGTEWQKDDYETEQVLSRAAKAKLLAEPGEFVRKFAVGLVAFWYEMTSLINSLIAGGLAVVAWVFAGIGLRAGWREGKPVWLFVLPALYLNLLLAALLALGRYSVPVIPALLVASAYGVDSLFRRFRSNREVLLG